MNPKNLAAELLESAYEAHRNPVDALIQGIAAKLNKMPPVADNASYRENLKLSRKYLKSALAYKTPARKSEELRRVINSLISLEASLARKEIL